MRAHQGTRKIHEFMAKGQAEDAGGRGSRESGKPMRAKEGDESPSLVARG
jgi:hypothetical protein